jgi:large subunit ribosomal protein L27
VTPGLGAYSGPPSWSASFAWSLTGGGAGGAGPCSLPHASCLGGVRWANSKAGGSTKNGRDSNPKFLGVKKFGGEWVEPGNIILRQRGQRYGIVESTATVGLGRDYTIFALQPGYVKFWYHALRRKQFVEVVRSPPGEEVVKKYPIVRVASWELPQLLALQVAGEAAGSSETLAGGRVTGAGAEAGAGVQVTLAPNVAEQLQAYVDAQAARTPGAGRAAKVGGTAGEAGTSGGVRSPPAPASKQQRLGLAAAAAPAQ